MKRNLIFFLAALFSLGILSSCEKADIDLEEENIETRLNSMLGLELSSVSNLLKSEGYSRVNLDNIYSFIGDNDSYTVVRNEKSPKTIYSAGYKQTNTTTALNTEYITYRESFEQKGETSYLGTIAANYFVDLEKGYVDSTVYSIDDLGDYIYQYEYDDPDKFYSVLMVNQNNLLFSSEVWWLGGINSDKAWALQFSEVSNSSNLNLSITCADYTIKN